MMERICEAGGFEAGSKRVRELWMTRVVNQQSKTMWQGQEELSQRQRDCAEVDEEKQEVDFRDDEKHNERNDQLFITRMAYVDERFAIVTFSLGGCRNTSCFKSRVNK